MLRILLDFSPDAGYKGGGFSETLLKKSLKFVLNKKNNTVPFNLGLILWLVKIDFISEK